VASVQAHRRLGETHRLFPVLETWRERFPADVAPWIELSKHHEHKTRDYGQALKLAAHAQGLLMPWQKAEHEALRRRIERLRKRVGAGGSGATPAPG
jgi:hypothetical protein